MVAITGLLAGAWLLPMAYGASSSASASSSQFTIPASVDVGANLIANVDDPQAVNAQSVCPGYKASITHQTSKGFTAALQLAGKPCNVYGMDVESLNLSVEYQAKDRVNIQIVPSYVDASNASWYFLNEDIVPRPQASPNASAAHSELSVSWSNDPSFNFKVIRKTTGDVLFNTEGSVLVYENQFIEFVTSLPDDYNLYGFGEQFQQLRILHNATLTSYGADAGNPIDANLYGSHPFYLDTRYFENNKTGSFTPVKSSEADPSKEYTSFSHGVFLRNAHGLEAITRPDSLTWRALGGSIDLTFYSGPSQAEVTKNYQTSTVGLPAMQKYSAFGFHQCRWGYTGWADLEDVVSNFEKFDIPLEYIWVDIDYMRGYRDFDNEENNWSYEEGEKFLDKLHQSGRSFVPLVDSALYIPNPDNSSDAYETYDRGAADDVFLKNPDGSLYIGSVWPGYTVFPDWHHPKAGNFWTNELNIWHKKVAYDGMWIDMGECSSFCVGSCGTGNLHNNPAHPPFALPGEPGDVDYDFPEGFDRTNATEAASASAADASQSASATTGSDTSSSTSSYLRTSPTPGARNINHPPYVINNVQSGHDLAVHAISPNATHVDGVQEYDVHNLNGHQILNATYSGLEHVFPSKRPFILGRATFAGSGKYAAHWGGDNVSKWSHLFLSISQALSFQLFGIPMFGVDTCGFTGNTDEELCNRWMQASAFFPFYRNHNVLASIPQEPYRWASVTAASKKAMRIRYALLPYIYTLFHHAHTTGATVMRALAWEFPSDPSLAAVDTQFLLGPALMVIPVLEPNASSVNGVFPGLASNETWYDWYTHTRIPDSVKPRDNSSIPAPLGHIPLYVRGGHVLPLQQPALTTRIARRTPWSLLVALDNALAARGDLYLDDGESSEPAQTKLVTFRAGLSELTAKGSGDWTESNPLANVTVLGVRKAPDITRGGVRFNGKPVPEESVKFNATSGVLAVHGLEGFTRRGAFEEDWVLKWD